MPTRTFIGLILLILALMVASTPALLNPASDGVKHGLQSAGVPGLADKTIKRDKRPNTGKVTNKLILKGYEKTKQDMKDTLPLGDRALHAPGGRLDAGNHRLLLPGETVSSDPLSPPVKVKGGVLLDGANCPVFRAGIDIPTLWKDKTQKQKYLDKAASADNPAACKALLTNRVAAATKTPIYDQPDARESAQMIRSDNLAMAIQLDYNFLLGYMFPSDFEHVSDGGTARYNEAQLLAQAASGP